MALSPVCAGHACRELCAHGQLRLHPALSGQSPLPLACGLPTVLHPPSLPVSHCPAHEVDLSGKVHETGLPPLPSPDISPGRLTEIVGSSTTAPKTHNPEGQPWKGVVVEPLMGQVGLSFKPQPQPPHVLQWYTPAVSTQPTRSLPVSSTVLRLGPG